MLHQWRGQLFCPEDHEGGFDMSGSNSAERKRHEPLVLVETADLSEEDWLDYRRRGIGGSDVSAIFGTSPFRTARDLYYDKLNIASVEDDEGNWVAMEMGHLLEPLVAKIFERKTGYRVYQIKKMFQHPQYRRIFRTDLMCLILSTMIWRRNWSGITIWSCLPCRCCIPGRRSL